MTTPTTLQKTMDTICAQHGPHAVMPLDAPPRPVPSTSTGFPELDEALGCGGYPNGRIIELCGPDPHMLSVMAWYAAAAVQEAERVAVFIDLAHTFDAPHARRLGVEVPKLLLAQPDSGEAALDIVQTFAEHGAGLIVVDNVMELRTHAELAGEEASQVSIDCTARLMSRTLRRLVTMAHRTGTTVLFLSPTVQRKGFATAVTEVPVGGNALKYYASQRLHVAASTDEGAPLAVVRVVKNKLAPPFRTVHLNLIP